MIKKLLTKRIINKICYCNSGNSVLVSYYKDIRCCDICDRDLFLFILYAL